MVVASCLSISDPNESSDKTPATRSRSHFPRNTLRSVDMKRPMMRFLLLVAVLLAAAQAHAKEWKDIRIGYEGAYPPFSSMQPDGTPVGFDIDVIHALCAQMHANCTLVQIGWDGLLPALMADKVDAIVASVAITAERKQKVAFTDKYYNTPRRLVVAKNSPIRTRRRRNSRASASASSAARWPTSTQARTGCRTACSWCATRPRTRSISICARAASMRRCRTRPPHTRVPDETGRRELQVRRHADRRYDARAEDAAGRGLRHSGAQDRRRSPAAAEPGDHGHSRERRVPVHREEVLRFRHLLIVRRSASRRRAGMRRCGRNEPLERGKGASCPHYSNTCRPCCAAPR